MRSKTKNFNLGKILLFLFASQMRLTASSDYDWESFDYYMPEDDSYKYPYMEFRKNPIKCNLTLFSVDAKPDGQNRLAYAPQQHGYIFISESIPKFRKPTCKEIMEDGSMDYYRDINKYVFFLNKEEQSGYNCFVNSFYYYKKTDCTWRDLIETNSISLTCSRSNKPLAKLAFELPEFDESTLLTNLAYKDLELPNNFDLSWNEEINLFKIKCIIDQPSNNKTQKTIEFLPFILIRKMENSDFNKTCKDFILNETVRYLSNNTVEYVMFRNIDGYNCQVNEDEILDNDNDEAMTMKIKSNSSHLLCQEKNVDEENGSLFDGFIRCSFLTLKRTTKNNYKTVRSTKDYFIYINSTEDIPCTQIIQSEIRNYHDTYLRFDLFKREISGFECDVDEADLVKEFDYSNRYLTQPKGLVCHRWISYRKPTPALGPYEHKIIQCPMENITFNEFQCRQPNIANRNFINVYTNEDIQCHSLIWNAEVEKLYSDYTTFVEVTFLLYTKEFSGYECDGHLPHPDDHIMFRVYWTEGMMLNCTKVKEDNDTIKEETYLLDCYYQDTRNETLSTSSYFYSAPAISMTSTTKENCRKIIQGFIKNHTDTGLVSLILYKEEVSGYDCSLEDNEKIEDLGTMYYIERKFFLPLICQKTNNNTLAPENVTNVDTPVPLKNDDVEVGQENEVQIQMEQKKNGSTEEIIDEQRKTEELNDEQQSTPEPLTTQKITEANVSSPNLALYPEEKGTVDKGGEITNPGEFGGLETRFEPLEQNDNAEVTGSLANLDGEQTVSKVDKKVEPGTRKTSNSASN